MKNKISIIFMMWVMSHHGVASLVSLDTPFIVVTRFTLDVKSNSYVSSGFLMQISYDSALGRNIQNSITLEKVPRSEQHFFMSQFENPLIVVMSDDKNKRRFFAVLRSIDSKKNPFLLLMERTVKFSSAEKIEQIGPKLDTDGGRICYRMAASELIESLLARKDELKVLDE